VCNFWAAFAWGAIWTAAGLVIVLIIAAVLSPGVEFPEHDDERN
jgi:hypothetical protein